MAYDTIIYLCVYIYIQNPILLAWNKCFKWQLYNLEHIRCSFFKKTKKCSRVENLVFVCPKREEPHVSQAMVVPDHPSSINFFMLLSGLSLMSNHSNTKDGGLMWALHMPFFFHCQGFRIINSPHTSLLVFQLHSRAS